MYLTERLPRETGRDYALRTLKDNIVRLALKPGSLVSENELAAEMGAFPHTCAGGADRAFQSENCGNLSPAGKRHCPH